METFTDILASLDVPLITLGQSSVTIGNLIVAASVLVLLGILTAKLNRLIIYRAISRNTPTAPSCWWTRDYIDRPGVRKSQLYYAIIREFREQAVEIPDPQRDVHIRDLPACILTGTPGGKDGDSP